MNELKKIRAGLIFFLLLGVATSCSNSGDKIEEGYEDVKDEACEMVNGKVECAADNAKDKAEDLTD